MWNLIIRLIHEISNYQIKNNALAKSESTNDRDHNYFFSQQLMDYNVPPSVLTRVKRYNRVLEDIT
jgi:hypothetical protein